MLFAGVDLHKHTITIVVVDAARKTVKRSRFSNLRTVQIVAFLKSFAPPSAHGRGGRGDVEVWNGFGESTQNA